MAIYNRGTVVSSGFSTTVCSAGSSTFTGSSAFGSAFGGGATAGELGMDCNVFVSSTLWSFALLHPAPIIISLQGSVANINEGKSSLLVLGGVIGR